MKSKERIIQICKGENNNPTLLTSEGRILTVICYVNKNNDGNFLGFTYQWRDITPKIEEII